MSHEIRTPLSGLIGMLELLTQTVLSLDQKIMVQNALESGNSLLRILSDILDWSKIEEGKLELSLQPTSIHRLLSEVVSTYSHVASSKGLYLSFEVDTEIQNTHLLDPLRLSQILNNFVSNGIKFTKKGSIVVSAEHIKNLTYAQQIRFSVKDTGIGLTQEEQVKLFQNYSQATADTARLYGGTGLGLAICRRLAHLMDGTIQIESVKGIGSIFSITLSLPTIEIDMTDLNSLTEEVKTIEPLVNSETNSARILAVDDHSVNLELLVRQLEMLGLKVDGAEDGEKALQLWYDKKYDLIITDCHMPHKDGYTLTRDIRKIEQNRFHKRIPIIAYTANILSEENEQCLAAGMDEVMIKPARISQLRQTLLKWLPHILNPISRETSELFIGIDSPFDFSDLKNIVSDKPGQILLLKKFNAHHQKDLGSLVEEISKGNLTEAEHLAHRLKGSCKVVGARNLVNGYSNIEAFLKENQIENARKEMDRMKEDVSKIELFVEEISNSKEGL